MPNRDINGQGLGNDCPETTVEQAAKTLGYDIHFVYADVASVQIDLTPAFALAPNNENIHWNKSDGDNVSSGRPIDLTQIESNANYFVRTGANGSAVGSAGFGHWQVVRGSDMENFVKSYRNNLGASNGQTSIHVVKVTQQNVINAANYLYQYRTNYPTAGTQNAEERHKSAESVALQQIATSNKEFLQEINGAQKANSQIAAKGAANVGTLDGARLQAVNLLVSKINASGRKNRPIRITLIPREKTQFTDKNLTRPALSQDERTRLLNNSFNLTGNNTEINLTRAETKWRCITSECFLYANGDKFLDSQVRMIVTTGCAPNLAGSVEDKNRYMLNTDINDKIYLQDMKVLISAWLQEQEMAGVNTVVMPMVGTGVYIPQGLRAKASLLVARAIRESVEEFLLTSKSVKKVYVATFSDEAAKSGEIKCYQTAKNNMITEVTETDDNKLLASTGNKGDIFKIIPELAKDKTNGTIGLINAGADNNIGGACAIKSKPDGTAYSTGKAHFPFEEQLADYSDVIMTQSVEFNEEEINNEILRNGVTPIVRNKTPKKKSILDDDGDDGKDVKPVYNDDTKSVKKAKSLDAESYKKAQEIEKLTKVLSDTTVDAAKNYLAKSGNNTFVDDNAAKQALIAERNKLLAEHLKAKLAKGKTLSKNELQTQSAIQNNPVADDTTVKVAFGEFIARQKTKDVKFALQKTNDATFDVNTINDADVKKAAQAKKNGEHVIVMTLVTDHQKGNMPAMDLIKVYEDPDTPEHFKTHDDVKNAIDAAMKKAPVTIDGVVYTVFGEVVKRGTSDERVDFKKRDINGKESVISQTDIEQYRTASGTNASLTKFVMDTATAYVMATAPVKTYVHAQVRETEASKTKYKFK